MAGTDALEGKGPEESHSASHPSQDRSPFSLPEGGTGRDHVARAEHTSSSSLPEAGYERT